MDSSSNERSILDLPYDILIMILEKMSVEDLKNICLVNSRFYELVTTTPIVNKKFKLNVDSKYNATITEALMESNRHFKNISIPCSIHCRYEPCKSSQYIDLMKKIGGHVTNMEFKSQGIFVCPKPVLELLQTIPNIESLIILFNFNILQCAEKLPKSSIPIKFKQLKKVDVPFEIFFPVLKHVNTLEKLIFFDPEASNGNRDNSSKSMELIEVLRNNQSTLKSLKFNTRHKIFEHDIQALCNLNLFEFEYSGFKGYDVTNIEEVNNLVKFFSNQNQMKRLTCSMDNIAFWDPIMKMTNLEFLDVDLIYNFSTEQVLTILKNHTKASVKFLKITSRFNCLSLRVCQTIVDYFSGVVNLDLSICRHEEEIPEGWFLSFDDHPTLTKVKMHYYASRNEMCALKIKQLEGLYIHYPDDFTADDWNLFTTNNPNIKSLNILEPKFSTESLKYIVTNLGKLEELEFDREDCPMFQYADLRLILENCRNIKVIDMVLHKKPEMHFEFLEEFAEKLKTIKLAVLFDPDPEEIDDL